MEDDDRVHAFDQRGWGRSVQTRSQRGLTGPTVMVISDISSVVESLLATAALMSVPLFLMGHSMGGAEVIQWAARGPSDIRSQIRGYVVESPYLALHPSAQPSRMTVRVGRLAAKLLPKRQLYVSFNSILLLLDQILSLKRYFGVL